MKPTTLLPWILAGGLAASTFWNLDLLRRLESVEARLDRRAPAASDATLALPGEVVSALGLSKEQCDFIRNCSRT